MTFCILLLQTIRSILLLVYIRFLECTGYLCVFKESAALGRGMPWATFLFKSMKGKILNFLHEIEKMISVISVQV